MVQYENSENYNVSNKLLKYVCIVCLQDFLVTQLIGRDLFDMWKVVNPMGLLMEELSQRGVSLPEPRLIKSFGANTVVPLHFIGLYWYVILKPKLLKPMPSFEQLWLSANQVGFSLVINMFLNKTKTSIAH